MVVSSLRCLSLIEACHNSYSNCFFVVVLDLVLSLPSSQLTNFFTLYLFLLQNPGQELGGAAERRRPDWLDDHFVEPDLSVLQAAVEKTMIWTEVEACKRQVRVPA